MSGVVGLTLLNLRGVKESVLVWVPIFFVFVATHALAIIYAIATHASSLGGVGGGTVHEVHTVSAQVGPFGLIALLLRAYSMGAGTYTGIEAVSNGLPILREPRVHTGRKHDGVHGRLAGDHRRRIAARLSAVPRRAAATARPSTPCSSRR